MVSFFWQRGFYYNRRFYFFSELSFFDLRTISGLSYFFWRLFVFRCEGLNNWPLIVSNSYFISYTNRTLRTETLKNEHKYLLTYLLIRLYPVLLNLNEQLRLNIIFFFFIRTYRGFALRFSRPLRRRTRGRTYFRKHLGKPPTRHYLRVSTSFWF